MRIPQHVLVALRLIECHSVSRCANRTTFTLADDSIEYTIVVRDKRQPDGHSREEVYAMLRTVRRFERRQVWQCPEPTEQEIAHESNAATIPQAVDKGRRHARLRQRRVDRAAQADRRS